MGGHRNLNAIKQIFPELRRRTFVVFELLQPHRTRNSRKVVTEFCTLAQCSKLTTTEQHSRALITNGVSIGGVQIGRLPGVVQLDMLAPLDILEDRSLGDAVQKQYGL